MAAIAVGPGAINRNDTFPAAYTVLDVASAADGTGTIDTVKIYNSSGGGTGLKVGIFYLVSGTTYKCRSAATPGDGTFAAGVNTFSGLSLAVTTGDFIGAHWDTGNIDQENPGASTRAYISGDYCTVDASGSYTVTASRTFSIEGSGTTSDGTAYIKMVNESEGINEGLQKNLGIAKTSNETVNINESHQKVIGFVKSVAEAVGITETVDKSRALLHHIAETVGITEGLQKARGFIQNINETIGLAEGIQKARGLVHSISETLGITEGLVTSISSTGTAIIKVVNETISITESYLAQKYITLLVALRRILHPLTINSVIQTEYVVESSVIHPLVVSSSISNYVIVSSIAHPLVIESSITE